MTSYKHDQALLDEIIDNIKATMGKKQSGQLYEREQVLELTEIIGDESGAETVSSDTKRFSNQVGSVQEGNYFLSDEEIHQVFKEVLKPYLQSWLNQNISKIVKEVVEKEVKSLFDKAKA